MDTVQQRMAAIFNEWIRRALADPEILDTYWKGLDMPTDEYGEQCAKYFTDLAAEMDADGLLPLPEPQAEIERLREPVAWRTDDYRTDKSATTYDPMIADRWTRKGWPVEPLYEFPPDAAAELLRITEQLAASREENSRLRKRRNEIDNEAYEYAEQVERLRQEMQRHLPILESLYENADAWDSHTTGTGIATLNGYRAALNTEDK